MIDFFPFLLHNADKKSFSGIRKENIMDNRTTEGLLSPDERERRMQLLLALDSAILLTQEMLDTKNTAAILFKPPRRLEEEELGALLENYARLVNVRETTLADASITNIFLVDICANEDIVTMLGLREITSVLGMWGENPSVVHGILDQCEAFGYMKGHWHMYCFVRY
jgi:hypothetical protein